MRIQDTLHIKLNSPSLSIGVVSDTHRFIDPRILEHIEHCDLVLHAGDIGDAEVLSTLATNGRAVYAVSGNNDTSEKWPSAQLKKLRSIPESLTLDIGTNRIQILHGDRINPAKKRHDKLRQRYDDAKLIIYGHSHHLFCDKEEKPWILNPGASGKTRTHGGASCAVINIKKNRWAIELFRVSA